MSDLRQGKPRGHGKSGMTLVEVTIAMAIVAFICGGLYTMGVGIKAYSNRARVETEARAYAKLVIEDLIAVGKENLAKGYDGAEPAQVESQLGVTMNCAPSIVWHAADGQVVSEPDADGYAEVHVVVSYEFARSSATNFQTYSTIVY